LTSVTRGLPAGVCAAGARAAAARAGGGERERRAHQPGGRDYLSHDVREKTFLTFVPAKTFAPARGL